MNQDSIRNLDRSLSIKKKMFEWLSKLNCPISTGFFITNDLEISKVNDFIGLIGDTVNKHDSVHDVVLSWRPRCSDLKYKLKRSLEKFMI